MNFQQKIILLLTTLLLSFSSSYKAQEDETENTDTNTVQRVYKTKGFHAGLYVGAFWANRNTAYIYDGYGFDINGQRNTFANSILYDQIVNVYGGANGGVDYIAQLLNVNHSDWNFTEQDMPINLRYTTTYLVGLNTRYQITKKASITDEFICTINDSVVVSSSFPFIGDNFEKTGTYRGKKVKMNGFKNSTITTDSEGKTQTTDKYQIRVFIDDSLVDKFDF